MVVNIANVSQNLELYLFMNGGDQICLGIRSPANLLVRVNGCKKSNSDHLCL